jgi:hypothetical protein
MKTGKVTQMWFYKKSTLSNFIPVLLCTRCTQTVLDVAGLRIPVLLDFVY